MEIKGRETSAHLYSNPLEKIRAALQTNIARKAGFAFCILLCILTFIIGVFGGLLATGFFGTLDEPSERTIAIIHAFGIGGLRELQTKVLEVKNEHIKIPFNYLLGHLAQPKRMTIDVSFENYQKLVYAREKAVNLGLLIVSDDEEVPARVTLDGKQVRADIRLKGENTDHVLGDKWSLRIKVKDSETLQSMSVFSIQDPARRKNLNEWIYLQALHDEDVLAVRYDFVDVTINGKHKGIYAIEEHFQKQLLESNGRLDGPIIRFDAEQRRDEVLLREQTEYSQILSENIDWYPTTTIQLYKPTTLQDSVRAQEFDEAKNLLEAWRLGKMKTSEVFDTDVLAKYFAVSTVFGGHHATLWSNTPFYYNPVTSKLEPIGFDAEIGNQAYQGVEPFSPVCLKASGAACSVATTDYYGLLFSDAVFYQAYIEELKRVSQREYMDSFFSEHEQEISHYTRLLHRENPSYHVFLDSFYTNQLQIQSILHPVNQVNAYYGGVNAQRRLTLQIGNTGQVPIEIVDLKYKDTIIQPVNGPLLLQRRPANSSTNYQEAVFVLPSTLTTWNETYVPEMRVRYRLVGDSELYEDYVLPWQYLDESFPEDNLLRETPNIERFSFIEKDEGSKIIRIKPGTWIVNESLIIPAGYRVHVGEGTSLDLTSKSLILSYSPLQLEGSQERPVSVYSSDGTGQGLVVLQARDSSTVSWTRFENLTSADKSNWQLTGAVTFYESPVAFDNVYFGSFHAEDILNIKQSSFSLTNSVFNQSTSDCLDIDFGTGRIESVKAYGCGNDGLDFSGSTANIKDFYSRGQGDKGISSGENSTISAEDIVVEEGYIGLASKDLSFFTVTNATLRGNTYGLALYEKKTEFGAGVLHGAGIILENNEQDYIKDSASELVLEGERMEESESRDVYDLLYPEEL
ncbi:CotH kinase family protein [Candidatus Pacearchaeota archaeon]|nr:CotH kinase family protein [Candidatus Pacearchaeota archaeon]